MTEKCLARRMDHIAPFYVMDLLSRAKELEAKGRSIIHMEVGEPDFATPQLIREAAKKSLDAGFTGYTPATGIPELRRKLSEHYRTTFGVSVDPGRIIVTPGSSGALQLIMGVLVNPGESVLMTDPGYPCNKHFVAAVNGVAKAVAVGPETAYQLTADLVEQHWDESCRAVMVATPSNPTGTLLSLDELGRIHEVVKARGGLLIVDEIYQGLVYDQPPFTVLSRTDDVFVINSFSKYFTMTGWRLGWLVAPERFVDGIDRLAQNIFISASATSQAAALHAFEPECIAILEERREAFRQRRDFLLPALTELGFSFPVVPEGAFYLYGDCSSLTHDSFSFAYDLLEQEGVAVTPGKDFGTNKEKHHIRFAYTTEIDQLREAVERIRRYLKNLNGVNAS